jgi:hypothetical protein
MPISYPPVNTFLYKFLEPTARMVLGFTAEDGATVYSDDYGARAATIVGTPRFLTTASGVPYIDLRNPSGTETDYLSIPSATWNAPTKELTIIAIAKPNALPSVGVGAALVSKITGGAGNDSAWQLGYLGTTTMRGEIFDASNTNVVANASTATTAWAFNALRFTPSTELKTWYNGSTGINTTSIPAAIKTVTSAVTIGRRPAPGTPQWFDGQIALVAIYASLLHDDHIAALYQQAVTYGVAS